MTLKRDVTATIACPLCHMHGPVPAGEASAAVGWRCTRCGQSWDGDRLAAVASYAIWLVNHAPKGRSGEAPAPRATVTAVRNGGR